MNKTVFSFPKAVISSSGNDALMTPTTSYVNTALIAEIIVAMIQIPVFLQLRLKP